MKVPSYHQSRSSHRTNDVIQGHQLPGQRPFVVQLASQAAPTKSAALDIAHLQQTDAGLYHALDLQAKLALGVSGNKAEKEANQMAAEVTQRLQMPQGQPPLQARAMSRTHTPTIQRFTSSEHKFMGDEGSKDDQGNTRALELAENYYVSFGDITAMAGDYFESIEQMKTLAANDAKGKGTREEVEYVRIVNVHGQKDKEDDFSKEAKDAVNERFFELVTNNESHFTQPEGADKRTNTINNFGNYHHNHEHAVKLAARAGASQESSNDAMLQEAFATHYLTDAFAAGHVRTERISISEWWDPKVPLFWTNLKLFMAEKMAYYLHNHSFLAGRFTERFLWNSIRNKLEGMTLPVLTFGDLVSGAAHDYDNEKGVDTQHGVLVGDGQLRDAQGNEVVDSSGKRAEEAANTEAWAVMAVELSLEDIKQAYQLGGSKSEDEVVKELSAGGSYAVEKAWPEAKPEDQQANNKPNWQQDSWQALLADSVMVEAIEIFSAHNAEEMEKFAEFESAYGISADLQEAAFQQSLIEPLKSAPVSVLKDVINYTPDVKGGTFGDKADNDALEYFKIAKAEGGLGTLTQAQRLDLINKMLAGVTGNAEEDAICDIIEACSISNMVGLVKKLGDGDAQAGIDRLVGFLEGNIHGSQRERCQKLLKRSPELANLL